MTQQPTADPAVWLTQEAHDRLAAELEHLKGPARAEISRRIADAREEGDLRENGGYHAAREEQSKAEARIVQLEDMLSRAQVGETPRTRASSRPAWRSRCASPATPTPRRSCSAPARCWRSTTASSLSVYSPQSPLGSAILGKQPGDTAEFAAPNGRTVQVEIVNAKPFRG